MRRENSHIARVFRLYNIRRRYTEHESMLINQRTQRMLLFQFALFTAAGAIITKILEWFTVHFFAQLRATVHWGDVVLVAVYITALNVVAYTGAKAARIARAALDAACLAVETLNCEWEAINARWKNAGLPDATQLHLPSLTGGGEKIAHYLGMRHVLTMPKHFLQLWLILIVVSLGFVPLLAWKRMRKFRDTHPNIETGDCPESLAIRRSDRRPTAP